jgi:hypothetical protein
MFRRSQPATADTICQITGCAVRIPRKYLMCRQHWFELPNSLRAQVESSLANWLAGREGVRPYLIARLRALIHVNRLHGCNVSCEIAKLTTYEEMHLEEKRATQKENTADRLE